MNSKGQITIKPAEGQGLLLVFWEEKGSFQRAEGWGNLLGSQMDKENPISTSHDSGKQSLQALALGALGVVYGDIGTSPLYAFKECFTPPHGVAISTGNILGLMSLMFWSLTFVIVLKYLTCVMRADNDGEGGIMSLMALVHRSTQNRGLGSLRNWLVIAGLAGTALLFGECVITPAISVLSAVEGLNVVTPAFNKFIVPLTLGILVGLFTIQRYGTKDIAAVFGPVMLIWFFAIGAAGIPWIVRNPIILKSLHPVFAFHFLKFHGWHGILVLGAVVLCITGAEALYADMGHFGRRAIARAWFRIVYPALVLNYLGQAALLLEEGPKVIANPFFSLVPAWMLYPMVAIATAAAVIASQALISGGYSLARQAVQLGFLPRLTITHTSGEQRGQIYVPEVNWVLMVCCIVVVLGFQTSTGLAAAYGIAVTGTMIVTSTLFLPVARWGWGWEWWKVLPLTILFLCVDIPFFLGNVVKISSGGWFPLAMGTCVFVMMTTWKTGRGHLAEKLKAGFINVKVFIAEQVAEKPVIRVPGVAVFMTSNLNVIPPAMYHNFKHNHVIHERTILLAITTEAIPEVRAESRIEFREIGPGIFQVIARYGFMQTPRVMEILRQLETKASCVLDPANTSFYLGRETLLVSGPAPMWRWRKRLFAFLARNARTATNYFSIPPERVVELGMQVEL